MEGQCSASTMNVCVGGLCGGGVQHIKANQGWQIDLDEQKQKEKKCRQSKLSVHQTPSLTRNCLITA